MKMNRRRVADTRLSGLTVVFLGLFFFLVKPCLSAVLYKSYLVKYDRGWDILCDPYVVQKDDWVYKIFRQKGELSAKDFHEFLNIFKRLNPHIHDIDRIRPNQNILIPLKKIEPDTFPNQAAGVVTIPFVTISKLSELLGSYSQVYEVKKGDSVSKLITVQFGSYGTKSYREGIELFRTLNPEIVDLNFIYIGQRINLLDPRLQNQAWYQSLFDRSGHIKKDLEETSESYSEVTVKATDRTGEAPTDPITEAASLLDGKLLNRGTYYFPRSGQEDFELDLSRNPVVELKDGSRIVFAQKTDSGENDLSILKSLWKNVSIVEVDQNTPVTEILGSVFKEIEKDVSENEISFSDHGMEVTVKAKWIKTKSPANDDAKRYICISLIEDPSQRTPDTMVRYLDQHNVIIKDVLSEETGLDPEHQRLIAQFVIPDIVALTPIDHKKFTFDLIEAMGYQYTKNVAITFPYAGVQVQAVSNLVSTGEGGKEFLIDFGELYGDAAQEIQKTGIDIIQILSSDSFNTVIEKILTLLDEAFLADPTFLAAKRTSEFNTALKIKGYLLHTTRNKKVLVSSIPLHNRVLQFLNEEGIKVILAGLHGN